MNQHQPECSDARHALSETIDLLRIRLLQQITASCEPVHVVTLEDLKASEARIIAAIEAETSRGDKRLLDEVLAMARVTTRRLEALNARTPPNKYD